MLKSVKTVWGQLLRTKIRIFGPSPVRAGVRSGSNPLPLVCIRSEPFISFMAPAMATLQYTSRIRWYSSPPGGVVVGSMRISLIGRKVLQALENALIIPLPLNRLASTTDLAISLQTAGSPPARRRGVDDRTALLDP